MEIYALVKKIGICSGSNTLIGLFSTHEKALATMKRIMKDNCFLSERNFSVTPIKINAVVNIVYDEW